MEKQNGVKTVSLCEDIIQLAITDREAGVTDQTSTPCANKESAETKKCSERYPNIFQNTPPAVTKVNLQTTLYNQSLY